MMGKPRNSTRNIRIALTRDKNIAGKFAYDSFWGRYVATGDLPWRGVSEHTRDWSDGDDAALRNYLAETYDLTCRTAVSDVWTELAERRRVDPLRDWLSGLPAWDGVERGERLFCEWLGVADCAYSRNITRLWLKGAVARALQPGCKFDHTLVLVGKQGIGKSSLLGKLGGKYFSDSLTDIRGKEPMEQLHGKWIVEISELQATRCCENESIKSFFTRQTDDYRRPYARHTTSYPRHCVFAGTTNEDVFLNDTTGARRFLILHCTQTDHNVYSEMTRGYVEQVWAEAMAWYAADPKVCLDDRETAGAAADLQRASTIGGEQRAKVEAYLDMPLPAMWDTMTLKERRKYHDDGHWPAGPGTHCRDWVCAYDIWSECLGRLSSDGEPLPMTPREARAMNGYMRLISGWERGGTRITEYHGRQRGYMRLTPRVPDGEAGEERFPMVDIPAFEPDGVR